MRRPLEAHTTKDLMNALWYPLIGVALMTLVYFLGEAQILNLKPWGIRPREAKGLVGIFLSPFLHGSREHLFNNAIPLLVLGWSLFYFYHSLAWRTLFWIALCGGLWVWLSGRADTNHIGASGLIYGLVAFLFFSGLLRKYIPLVAISLLVIFLYGSLVWGVLPVQEHVSWEGHLWGAVAGIVMALYYRPAGPQRPKFAWETEEEVEVPEEEQYWNIKQNQNATLTENARPYRIVYHVKKGNTSSSRTSPTAIDPQDPTAGDKPPEQGPES